MEDKIKKSLEYSLKDGIFASVMQGISENFITPYALAMKASAGTVGILASAPNLLGSLLQVKTAALAERLGSRKALITSAVLIQTFMWLPIIAIPYLSSANQPFYLIVFYSLFIAAGGMSFPPWSSLMSDHVGPAERGKVFGWRNRLFGIINVSSLFLAGFMLYAVRKIFPQNPILGFTIIFFTAFLARLISLYFLTRMYEVPLVIRDEHRFSFFNFLKRIRRSNFGRFVIFAAFMNFSVNIAAPFFAVYMLRDLKFNYLVYTVITMSATIMNFGMMNIWGAHADEVGNRRVLRLTSCFIPFIPLFWLFSHNVFYLVLVQIFAGFFWSGFNLSASNFIYDAVTPEKRTRCVAYFNVVNGLAIFLGAATGGYLLRILPSLFGYKILTLLLISGGLRFFAVGLCSFVREVRRVRDVSNSELFYSIIGLKPMISASNGK